MCSEITEKDLELYAPPTPSFDVMRQEAQDWGLIKISSACTLSEPAKELLGEQRTRVEKAVPQYWTRPYDRGGTRPSESLFGRTAYVESIFQDLPEILGREGCAELIARCREEESHDVTLWHLLLSLAYCFWNKYRDEHLLLQLGIRHTDAAILTEQALEHKVLEKHPKRLSCNQNATRIMVPPYTPTRKVLMNCRPVFSVIREQADSYAHTVCELLREEQRLRKDSICRVNVSSVLTRALPFVAEIVVVPLRDLRFSLDQKSIPRNGDLLIAAAYYALEHLQSVKLGFYQGSTGGEELKPQA